MRWRIKELILSLGYFTFKIIRTPIKLYWKVFNMQTRGVRVLIVHEGSIALVRHWYNSLWVMPGGGIKKNETPEQAAVREVEEELGIADLQLEYLLGIYSNDKNGKRDTVYCYVILLDNRCEISKRFSLEVSDRQWFGFNALPDDASVATKQRITEFQNQDISGKIRPWS